MPVKGCSPPPGALRFEGRPRDRHRGPSRTKSVAASGLAGEIEGEAIEWLSAPFQEGEVELRQVFETEDFGDNMTPEMREQEERLRAQTAARKK